MMALVYPIQHGVGAERWFIMGILGKKQCGFCGNDTGVLNYRKKYAEGYLCQDCYYKLSPWFQLSDNTPGQVLGAQFSYREANRAAVAAFHPNRSYGFFLGYNETSERRNLRVYHRLLIDDSAHRFAMHLPGKTGRAIARLGYRFAQKVVGFN